MHEMGVIHGRFHVLHNDHLKYLLAGKARCRHLVVGITNPDPSLTRDDPADPERSRPSANPLTYFERYSLVRAALGDEGFDWKDFSVVPFPINVPDLYPHYVPMDAVFFLTIYDPWGKRKLEKFQSLGLRTEVLWEKPIREKGLSASDVRHRMIRGQPWEDLVPPGVARLLKKWDLPARLRQMSENGD